jgi:GT2 family glycosyltransferase
VTQKVGIVVPTLGTRPDYLEQNLRSIRAAGEAFVLVVAPKSFDQANMVKAGLIDQFVEDPKKGLAEAINLGFERLPKNIELINWLGDDDLLTKDSLEKSSKALQENTGAAFAFGACDYIDDRGNKIWANRSGPWAVPLLRFGPDLIPQPGALFRRDAFNEIGQLSSNFGWAFDFDLFIKLSKTGKGIYLPETLAAFRWHPDSLSVGMRKKSVAEASAVRKSHLPAWVRPLSILWEWPIRQVTLIAGSRVSKLAKSGTNR